jgi:hypothetical protein
MRKFKEHVKYAVRRQADGTYAILQKYIGSRGVDIHSTYDTYDEAQDELESLYSKPTQAEAMKMINDLRFSMDAIK